MNDHFRNIDNITNKLMVNSLLKSKINKFLKISNIPVNKINVLLKMDNNTKRLGYIYRLVVTYAHFYGVPKIYIKDCINKKNIYKYWSSGKFKMSLNFYENKIKVEKLKKDMNNSYDMLISATIDCCTYKNSRKGKIEKLLNKMV